MESEKLSYDERLRRYEAQKNGCFSCQQDERGV